MSYSGCVYILVATITLVYLTAGQTEAITIRHDVDDSLYIAKGAESNYESAGMVEAAGTCAVAGGMVVHPEWVLTAAHCVPATVPGRTVNFSLGPSNSNFYLTVAADNWFRHSSYMGDVTTGFDFGLIHLTEPILEVTPTRLYRGTSELNKTTTVVGYGTTGTGLTGNTQPRGTRRGGQFVIDRFGGAIGVSNNIVLGDFDNPDNPGDSMWGSAIPLPLESAIAFNDSGSPWFIDVNNLTYAAAVSSFVYETDGEANSDYGDVSGGNRISRQITWIDGNHDRTIFWDGTVGNWGDDSRWVASSQPTAVNAAVIDLGQATISAAGEEAKFVFVDGTGKLEVGNTFAVNDIVVNRQGTFSPIGSIALATNVNMSAGTLEFSLGTGDQFNITGNVQAGGELGFKEDGYNDPVTRGDFNTFTTLVASDLEGSFASINYEGSSLDEGTKYVGSNQNGDDGLFRIVAVDQNDSNEIVLTNYLALPGDANGDLIVDGLDYVIWSDHKFTDGNDWSTGDFTGDGITDGLDFIQWNDFKFTSANLVAPRISVATAAVPEPVGAVLIWTGLAGLAVCRRWPL